MVEEMLGARGIEVTYETVRQWALKLGQQADHVGGSFFQFSGYTRLFEGACGIEPPCSGASIALLKHAGLHAMTPSCLHQYWPWQVFSQHTPKQVY